MSTKDQFYQEKYFSLLDERLTTIEKKIDTLVTQVTYIYAFSAGVGALAAIITKILIK